MADKRTSPARRSRMQPRHNVSFARGVHSLNKHDARPSKRRGVNRVPGKATNRTGCLILLLCVVLPATILGLFVGNIVASFDQSTQQVMVSGIENNTQGTAYEVRSNTAYKPRPTVQPAPTATKTAVRTNDYAVPKSADYRSKLIKYGQAGNEVRELQRRLISLGFLAKGSADGNFGDKTRSALVAFQKAAGITQTGECDYTTYVAMTASDAPSITVAPTKKPSESKQAKGDTITVYLTRTGDCYHDVKCAFVKKGGKLKKDLTTMTLNQAIAKGKIKCSKCYKHIRGRL